MLVRLSYKTNHKLFIYKKKRRGEITTPSSPFPALISSFILASSYFICRHPLELIPLMDFPCYPLFLLPLAQTPGQ